MFNYFSVANDIYNDVTSRDNKLMNLYMKKYGMNWWVHFKDDIEHKENMRLLQELQIDIIMHRNNNDHRNKYRAYVNRKLNK